MLSKLFKINLNRFVLDMFITVTFNKNYNKSNNFDNQAKSLEKIYTILIKLKTAKFSICIFKFHLLFKFS